jgi:hypothetical protein
MRLMTVMGVAFAAVCFAVSADAAGSMPASGTIGVYATPGSGTVARIVLTGAIGDYGTATQITKSGRPNQNGGYVRVVLKHGGFEVNSVALNKKANSARPLTNNTTTCSFSVTASGPTTLFNGTGMYAGISGTVRVTETFAGVGRRYASGPKKGQCNRSDAAQPLAFWSGITGLGKVAFK